MVPSSRCPGSTDVTHAFLGRPAMWATTLVQVFPPSLESWRLPSSVPTQMTLPFFGDSAMEKIVVCISADELSTVTPPDCSCFCFSGSLVVRSGEIRSQVWPKSRERNKNWAPIYIVPFSLGESAIGVFQLKRSFSL